MAKAPAKLQTRVRSVMEDSSARAIARTYATAFLNAVSDEAEAVLEEYESFLDDVLANNPEFETLLLSRIVSRDQKSDLIERVVAPLASKLFANFLQILARHDRLELLALIFEESQHQFEVRAGRQRVHVTSARPLSKEALDSIQQRLDAAFDFLPVLETETDPSLLGGLVIRVENTVYDSSLRSRVKQLRGRLLERSLNEIQSGRDRFSNSEGN